MSSSGPKNKLNQGIYSPVPFYSESDCDESSEEEVFNQQTINSEQNNISGKMGRNGNSNHKGKTESPKKLISNGKITATTEFPSLMTEYRPLSNSETSLNGFGDRSRLVLLPNSPTTGHEEPKDTLQTNENAKKYGWNHMSPIRRCLFIVSILVCVFTIFGFLWLLPCDFETSSNSLDCSITEHSYVASPGSWETLLEGIEILGTAKVIEGRMIFLVRGPQPLVKPLTNGEPNWKNLGYGPFKSDKDMTTRTIAGGGVIALDSFTGSLLWSQVLTGSAPKFINCDLIDLNGDGKLDCLIHNPDWLLAAVNPTSGTLVWYLHSNNGRNISSRRTNMSIVRRPTRLRFPPLKINDIDGDGIADLCALCGSQLSPNLDSFVLISGKNGNIIGRLVNISGCISLTGLELEDSDNNLSFTCINQVGGESVRIMSISEIHLRAINKSQQDPLTLPPLQKRQQPPRGNDYLTVNDGKIYTLEVKGHRLNVENRGICPRCRCIVSLIDSNNSTIWSYQSKNERSMSPIPLRFTGSIPHKGIASGTTSSLSGFVLKFWQWTLSSPRSSRIIRNIPSGSSTIWNTDKGLEDTKNKNLDSDVRVTLLKERVLLITFNDTDLHIINASQSDVAQICAELPLSERLPGKQPICQPELSSQQFSLLIADLDVDNTQELVSFTTTYIPVQDQTNTDSTKWQLISKIKAIHLETELPKLS